MESGPDLGPSTDLSTFVRRKIYVYVLRNSPPDARLKIKASFDHEIRYTFNQVEAFDDRGTSNPSIYILELPIEIDQEKRLIVNDNLGRWPVSTYRLRISRKIPRTDTSFVEYKDEQNREFLDPQSTTHYFIFDANFGKNMLSSPPGSFLLLISGYIFRFLSLAIGHNVPFWSQLCLFTYYLLHHGMYEVFDSLVEQFQQIMQRNPRLLRPEELNDFFQTCFLYSSYAVSDLTNSWMADKILIRMTGLLPITRNNLDVNFHFTNNYVHVLIDDVKEHYDNLFALLTDHDWPLFRDGFSLYLAVELLSRTNDTLALVHQVRNEDCKRDLANVLLKRLEILQRPVLAVNWIDLFTLADPNILTLKQLQLTRSVETYIKSLAKILDKHTNEMDLDTKVIRHFDESIAEDRLTGKNHCLPIDVHQCLFFSVNLETIVFLLKFSSTDSTDEDESSKKILGIVNQAIEESQNLRTKVKRYLYELSITQEQYTDVRFVISCLSKSDILHLVNKNELVKNLLQNTKLPKIATFLKEWFYSFLVFDGEATELNKKMYLDVLQHWSLHFIRDHDVTMRIFQEIDLFIHQLTNQEYRTLFIQQMVELCFKQSKVFGRTN